MNELERLREQVTELQDRCTELVLEVRDLRWSLRSAERGREVLSEQLLEDETLRAGSIYEDVVSLFDALGQNNDVARAGFVGLPSEASLALARRLIAEETSETLHAIDRGNLVGIADGIVDSIVVLTGLAVRCGLPLAQLWHQVHESNMEKRGGPVDEHGKGFV